MLSKILKKSDCASCRFCCSFRRQSLWETPLFDLETKERLEKNFRLRISALQEKIRSPLTFQAATELTVLTRRLPVRFWTRKKAAFFLRRKSRSTAKSGRCVRLENLPAENFCRADYDLPGGEQASVFRSAVAREIRAWRENPFLRFVASGHREGLARRIC